MNRKSPLALLLILAMLVTMTVTSVSAVTFSDISTHWSKDYVEDVASQGLINGYDDGTFGPDEETTYCQALLFCSRVVDWDYSVQMEIWEKWYDDVAACLPTAMVSWAASELCICLEMGILTLDELEALCDDGSISSSIPREELALYLTRAIQLDELACNLSSTSMSFYDYSSIGTAYRPYVFLLNYYDIIEGDDLGYFNPQSYVTRGAMATMLSRTLDLIEEEGILFELLNFNDYDDWFGGVITTTSTSSSTGITTLTLSSDAEGSKTVTIPASASIYEFNLQTTHSAFTKGDYVRVNYNSSGTVTSALIGGTTTIDEGTIVSLSQESISIWGDDGYATYDIDGFTAVSIGSKTGDASLIDVTEDYTSAQCTFNQMGQLTDLVLQGGTEVMEGIFYKYSSSTVQFTALDGVLYSYPAASGMSITVDGSSASTLSSSLSGDYITLYISSDSGEVDAALVDTTVTMVQGSIKTYSTSADPRTLTIKDLDSGYSYKYYVSDDAVFYQDDEEVTMNKLEKSYFVTALFDGDTDDEIIYVWAINETYYVSGTLLAIDYDVITTLELLLDDGTTATYYIDTSSMPDIERDDEESSLSKLRTGDLLDIEIEYNIISEIEATSQDADLTGTILSISKTSAGTYIEVELEDGEVEDYLLSSSVSIVQDGTDLSISDLDIDMEISMMISEDLVFYIEVDGVSTSVTILTVKLISTDTSNELFYGRLPNDSTSLITIDVDNATFRNASGNSTSISSFDPGDYVQAYGSYSGSTFVATLVVYLYSTDS